MSKLELFEQIQPSHGVLMPHGTETDEVLLLQDTEIDLYVSPEQVDAIIAAKEIEFDDTASSLLKSKLQKDIIQAIAVPLGLGNITAAYDQHGGAVDTIHNARERVFATESAKEDCAKVNRDYNDKSVSQGYRNKNERYNERHSEANEQVLQGTLKDGYSGETFKADSRGKVDKDQEHIVAAVTVHKNYDDDNGRKLSGVETEDLANIDDNITFTSGSVNKSKGAKSVDEYLANRLNAISEKQKLISKLELEKAEGTLSPKQETDLKKAKNYVEKNSSVCPVTMEAKEKKAIEAIEKKINDNYYKSPEFANKTASAAVSEGGRMALQQLMGSVLVELFSGIITEIKDAYKNGRCQDSILADIKVRCKRIAANVATKWKEHVVSFGEGFLAGVLSSIVTTILNTFVTSAKRLARLLREGFNSVLRAFKTIVLRPEGTTMADAKHEAVKLIFTGGVLCGSILLEDAIEKIISSVIVLAPIATIISIAVTGAITALAIILISLMIDKLDLFGAMEAKKNNFVSKSLTNDLNEELDKFEKITKDRTFLIDMS